MITNLANRLTNYLIEYSVIEVNNKELVIYGIVSAIKLLLNIITTILLGIMFNLLFESVVFLVMFSMIRTYAGGYHAKEHLTCYFISSLIVISVLLLLRYTPEEYMKILSTSILIPSVLFISICGPVDTKNKKFDIDEIKYYRKILHRNLAFELVIVILFMALGVDKYSYLISLGILLSATLVLLGSIFNYKR